MNIVCCLKLTSVSPVFTEALVAFKLHAARWCCTTPTRLLQPRVRMCGLVWYERPIVRATALPWTLVGPVGSGFLLALW